VSKGALPEELPAAWRTRANELRLWASAEGAACALERAAADLERALQHRADEVLTLSEAAEVSGYSADHLGRLIRQQKLRSVGRAHSPRVRREDLPQKPGHVAAPVAGAYDPIADARSLLSRRGGQ
jgi:hypothetical protein